MRNWWNRQETAMKVALIGFCGVIMAALIGIVPDLIKNPDSDQVSLETIELSSTTDIETPTTLLIITPSPTPFSTPALVCGTPHPPIAGTSISGDVKIVRPGGSCAEVSQHETILVSWNGVPGDTYTLWVLVYSPFAKRYYPHPCSGGTLKSNGNLDCRVNFARLNEPYEAVIILADPGASMALEGVALSGTGILQADLPQGIFEKDSLLARRTQ